MGVTTPVDVIALKMQILIKFSCRQLQRTYLHTHARHVALRGFKSFEEKIK